MGHVVRSAGLLIAATAFSACSPAAELPSPPANPSASPVPESAAACPSASGVALPDLADGMAPADAVTAYLEAGGDPTTLAASLFDLGWGTPNSTVVWTDIDGDGHLDLAAGLTGAPGGNDETGSVTLWRCQDGAYLRADIAPPRPDFGPPEIHQARDLTVDGLPELIVAYPRCGAHTCFAQFAVYQWDGESLVDRFRGPSDDMPFPELALEAADPSTPAAIEITATGIGSVGAGPYRMWSRTWTWDGEARAFVPGDPVLEAPRFRVHVIHDADDAYLRGDLAAAVALYRRAIDDDALLDWPAPGHRRTELAAYAAYRRVLAFLAAGDALSAQAELNDRLSGRDASTAAYAELARRLLAGYADSGFAQACAEVPSFVRENTDAVVAPLDFGYANRTYTAEGICPMIGR